MKYTPEKLREKLHAVGLSATNQRLALGGLIFGHGDRHLSAEQLRKEAMAAEIPVSLATIYNTLRQFSGAGLLREVVVEPGRSYFDTNLSEHHHFFHEDEGRLEDISADRLSINSLPPAPNGTDIRRVDIIIRVGRGHAQPG